MTANTGVHTCSYYCERPECIKRQRDELMDRMEAALAQQPAAPSGAVNVVGMPEFDGLMDHIYEYGTTAEGVVEKANAFARAVIARYTPQQPAAVDVAKETDLWRCTVCGRVGTVWRCCGEETREPLAPPSAPVGVDFAAVASILRRALRDGTHYGYRRDFILQQALALESLSQQPAAAGEESSKGADVAQPKRRRYDPSGSLSEYGIFPECDAQPLEHQGDK